MLACWFTLGGVHVARAEPVNLFTSIKPVGEGNTPPEDALAIWDSSLGVTGLAAMPTEIAVRIPRRDGDVIATVRLDRMDRREGFTERDPWACDHGDPQACEIIPYPDLPPNLFSYSWLGRGDGYDLRFTVHRGYAGGVLDGPAGRFDLAWNQVKELKLEYFRFEGDVEDPGEATSIVAPATRPVPVLSAAAVQAATLTRIEPKSGMAPSNNRVDYVFRARPVSVPTLSPIGSASLGLGLMWVAVRIRGVRAARACM